MNSYERLSVTLDRIGKFSTEHRDLLLEAMNSYLAFINTNNVNHSLQMTATRRKRLSTIQQSLIDIDKVLSDDPYILTFLTEAELSGGIGADGDDDVDASIVLDLLRDGSGCLSYISRLVGRSLADNSITTKRPETEFRERLWSSLAVIYKAATGRDAAVTTSPIDNGVSGDFVDLVDAVHGALAALAPDRTVAAASRHEIKRFCAHWREVRGVEEPVLLRELHLLRKRTIGA